MQLTNTVSVAAFLLGFTFSGCVSASRTGEQEKRRTDFISSEEISRSASTNAWDLLRNRVRQYDFGEDRYGRPRTIRTKRGRSTIVMADSDTPLVVVDGARLTDFGVLRDLPTGAIASIELLSGINGTSAHGTNASAGVIYIHTWDASSR